MSARLHVNKPLLRRSSLALNRINVHVGSRKSSGSSTNNGSGTSGSGINGDTTNGQTSEGNAFEELRIFIKQVSKIYVFRFFVHRVFLTLLFAILRYLLITIVITCVREESSTRNWFQLYTNGHNSKPHTHVDFQNYLPSYLKLPKNQPNLQLVFLTQYQTHGTLSLKIWKQQRKLIVTLPLCSTRS